MIFVINLTLLQDRHILQQRIQILSKHKQILQFFTPSAGPKNFLFWNFTTSGSIASWWMAHGDDNKHESC